MTETPPQGINHGSSSPGAAQPGSGYGLARVVMGFVCGFTAVFFFHQVMLGILHIIAITPRSPLPVEPTWPFGIPQVVSAAFWGGVWGIVFAVVDGKFPRGGKYWISAVVFGALALTLVNWFVVAPLQGAPLMAGGDVRAMLTGLLVNGAWGLGTALLLWVCARCSRPDTALETVHR